MTSTWATAMGHENIGGALSVECTTETRKTDIFPVEAQGDTLSALLERDPQDNLSLEPAEDLT